VKNRFQFALTLTFLLMGQPAHADTFATQYLGKHRMQMITEGGNDCGPVSLFNSLLMSGPQFSRVLSRLPGRIDWDRYENFLKTYGSRATVFFPDGRPRWADNGIQTYDLTAMGNDLAGGSLFTGIIAGRRANEPSGFNQKGRHGFAAING
jgi:hypothetical protein